MHKPAYLKNRYVYAVQVGVFSDPVRAKRLKNQLSSKGYKSRIVVYSPESGETLSRVVMGHYIERKQQKNWRLVSRTRVLKASLSTAEDSGYS